ncbi:phage portal protein [Neorhizobium sp. JUb45]|uniref:phage portal protein n=1 Tax=Neorhizobium sp. JUb45 TaxID=2485113 RepID=UPI0010539532|nr:phage portal protein [Neorhizobium sp. JUb45]TCR01074.1 HK97 family phage portal protein [Neorhizobium sp. JUb45]
MGIFDRFRRSPEAATIAVASPRADSNGGVQFSELYDSRLIDFLRDGLMSASGFTVNPETALRNPAMFRATSLISNSIGMLPLHLIKSSDKTKATDHPLFKLLHRRPNSWQSAFDFRACMQLRALVHKDAYALIVRSRNLRTGKNDTVRLVPLDPRRMTTKLTDDWRMQYVYQPSKGAQITYAPSDIFHLRGVSLDGIHGFSLVEQAKQAIGLALTAELASGRMFQNGNFVGGALSHKGKLSDEAYDRLKASLAEKEGAENAGKSLILEEGMDWKTFSQTARDSQMAELRKLQVEEIARISGVPRPLLMVDETSWGSGIEALGQFFVAYALNPWFEAWQQAIERCLLDDEEAETYEAKFNPAALLRGSLKDQADFLSKALGSGGHAPWMHVDEVRNAMDLPQREAPPHTMMAGRAPVSSEPADPPSEPAPKPAKKQGDDDDE